MEYNIIQNLKIISENLKESIDNLASSNHAASQATMQDHALTEIADLNQQIDYLHEYLREIDKKLQGKSDKVLPYWFEIISKINQRTKK